MRKNILTLILILILFSCKVNKAELLYLNPNLGLSHKEFSIVFYHSGECSFCYGVLSDLEKTFPQASIVSVTQLKDTCLLNFQLSKISFKGCSIIDSSGLFYQNNMELLQKKNLFLVNSKNEVLASELEYNLNVKETLKRMLYEK